MIELPILADCNGDLAIFDTLAAAEDYIEPRDVLQQLYKVYDSKGRRLEIGVREGNTLIWNSQIDQFEIQELRAALLNFIYYVRQLRKEPVQEKLLQEASLDELVQMMVYYENTV